MAVKKTTKKSMDSKIIKAEQSDHPDRFSCGAKGIYFVDGNKAKKTVKKGK